MKAAIGAASAVFGGCLTGELYSAWFHNTDNMIGYAIFGGLALFMAFVLAED